MYKPINANSLSIGEIFSHSAFLVPQYQREYSWQQDEVAEFWKDLQGALPDSDYFLGLIILTNEEEEDRQFVVDGQQRIVTLSLLATALYFEALKRERKTLADKLKSDFLSKIDYNTDETHPRVLLSDVEDNQTLQHIFKTGEPPNLDHEEDSVSKRIVSSYKFLKKALIDDLKDDPFKRLGKWAKFLSSKVYLAVFVHPDAETAYTVFEVVNQRGRDLTTADLLKNFVLSQAKGSIEREDTYNRWQALSKRFPPEGSNNTFVQFIRHVVTVECGHVLPKDLYKFLASRQRFGEREPPTTTQLLELLEANISLYNQMMDNTSSGPATPIELGVFEALNSLGVISVRPILMAIHQAGLAQNGAIDLLKLVVRRIVVGSLGTGNVERRFSEVARSIRTEGTLEPFKKEIADLFPSEEEFVSRLQKRNFSKSTLSFLRKSIQDKTCTPSNTSTLHFVHPLNDIKWDGMSDVDAAFWSGTLGNSVLVDLTRRPPEASINLDSFKEYMLPHLSDSMAKTVLEGTNQWEAKTIENLGKQAAIKAAEIWY